MKHCKRGHPQNEINMRLYVRKPDGKKYTMCRACAAYLQRARYRNDEAYRAYNCARNKARYQRRAASGEVS